MVAHLCDDGILDVYKRQIMNPANQYVAELVKSGKLGKIMRVHATYCPLYTSRCV